MEGEKLNIWAWNIYRFQHKALRISFIQQNFLRTYQTVQYYKEGVFSYKNMVYREK